MTSSLHSSRPRRQFAISLAAVLLAAGIVLTGHARTASAHHVPTPAGAGQQFLWPVSSWVSATDHYDSGVHHSGSADLSIPHFTPIRPARAGVVVFSGFRNGAYGVRIRHDAPGGKTYVTQYGHMVAQPPVQVGDQVDLGTVIGYVGRTGNAYWGGSHIHFAIRVMDTSEFDPFGGQVMLIPGLKIGDWTHVNDFIPGIYAGLSPIESRSDRSFDVQVTWNGLRAYQTTNRGNDEVIAELPAGSVPTVLDTRRGQYQIRIAGQLGWIPHSGTAPAASILFNVRVTASPTANVRRSPEEAANNLIGVVSTARDPFLSGFQRGGQSGNWVRVLWRCDAETNRSQNQADDTAGLGGCPGRGAGQPPHWKYGWMGPAVTNVTNQFHTRTRIVGLNIHGNKVINGANWPDTSVTLGEFGGTSSLVHVLEIKNGWYRINRNDRIGWVRGWYTTGPH